LTKIPSTPDVEVDYPAYWDPEPGDKLVGIVTDLDIGHLKKTNRDVPIVVVQPDEGEDELSLWLTRTVLRNEMAKCRPEVGHRIEVIYQGAKVDDKGDVEYHKYRVRNLTVGRKFDWSKVSADGDDWVDQPEEAPARIEPPAAAYQDAEPF
jgi:hypothetical protein